MGNFRSFNDDQEISFVASAIKSRGEKIIVPPGKKFKLLPIVGIYGANASGKTNVISALKFMTNAVERSQVSWKPNAPISVPSFKLDNKSKNRPSYFELDFIHAKVRYQYGFLLDKEKIHEEWLFAYPKNTKQVLFLRNISNKPQFKFGRGLKGSNRAIEKLTRPNSLFLSCAAQNGHRQLSSIFKLFESDIGFASEEDRASRTRFTSDTLLNQDNIKYPAKIMSVADFGISEIKIEKAENLINEKQIGDLKEAVRRILEVSEEDFGNFDVETPPDQYTVKLLHSGTGSKFTEIDFDDESQGTKEFYALLGPILWAIGTGSILVVDELERSLHPALAKKILSIFSGKKTNPKNAQLLFTSQSTNLLNSAELRRDQIWFAEKDKNGCSHLYPLTDFRPRESENLERGYLQGRFGAIPFLGDFDIFGEISSTNAKTKISQKVPKKRGRVKKTRSNSRPIT